MNDELVTLEKYETAIDAEMAKLKLDTNGIESYVLGGGLASVLPIGGIVMVELKVKREDYEKAKEILESHGQDDVEEDA